MEFVLYGRTFHTCESCGSGLEVGEVVVCENRDGFWYHFRAVGDTHWDGAENPVAENRTDTPVGDRVPRHVVANVDVRT